MRLRDSAAPKNIGKLNQPVPEMSEIHGQHLQKSQLNLNLLDMNEWPFLWKFGHFLKKTSAISFTTYPKNFWLQTHRIRKNPYPYRPALSKVDHGGEVVEDCCFFRSGAYLRIHLVSLY